MSVPTRETKEKVSISLSPATLRFADKYQREHGLSSRSEVFEMALKALRRVELIEAYEEAARDYELHPEKHAEAELYVDELPPSDGSEWL